MADETPTPTPTDPPPASHFADTFGDHPLKDHPGIRKFETVASLAEGYAQLEQKLGADPLIAPGADASPQEVRQFFNKLGVPESPDKYSLGEFRPPEGMPLDANYLDRVKEKCWEVGVTDAQWKRLSDFVLADQVDLVNQANELWATQRQAAENDLKAKLGTTYESWQKEVETTAKAMFGDDYDEVMATPLLKGGTLGENVAFREKIHEMHALIAEDTILPGGGPIPALTPAAADAQIREFKANKELMVAFGNANHPGHEAAVNKWETLLAAKGGDTTQQPGAAVIRKTG